MPENEKGGACGRPFGIWTRKSVNTLFTMPAQAGTMKTRSSSFQEGPTLFGDPDEAQPVAVPAGVFRPGRYFCRAAAGRPPSPVAARATRDRATAQTDWFRRRASVRAGRLPVRFPVVCRGFRACRCRARRSGATAGVPDRPGCRPGSAQHRPSRPGTGRHQAPGRRPLRTGWAAERRAPVCPGCSGRIARRPSGRL